jgi:virginiamycin B lyase
LTITEFPTGGVFPNTIVAGPDGNLWFTLAISNEIGRITQTGVVKRFPLPTPLPPGFEPQGPIGIIVGRDGRLWFAENAQSQLGAIDPRTAVIQEFPLPLATGPWYLTLGSDGMFWITELFATSQIGRATRRGRQVRTYDMPPGVGPISLAGGITLGTDGRVWFGAPGANSIGAISHSGTVTLYPLPALRAGDRVPAFIISGPDGNLWFTEQGSNQIGRMRTDGTLLGEFDIPTPGSAPNQITVGPDGNIWFTEIFGSNIAKLDVACATAP